MYSVYNREEVGGDLTITGHMKLANESTKPISHSQHPERMVGKSEPYMIIRKARGAKGLKKQGSTFQERVEKLKCKQRTSAVLRDTQILNYWHKTTCTRV